MEDCKNAPPSNMEQRLSVLAKAYRELCDQFQKDPMKSDAYLFATNQKRRSR